MKRAWWPLNWLCLGDGMMKRALGFAMIGLPFIALGVFFVAEIGILPTLVILAGFALVTGLFAGGFYLLGHR